MAIISLYSSYVIRLSLSLYLWSISTFNSLIELLLIAFSRSFKRVDLPEFASPSIIIPCFAFKSSYRTRVLSSMDGLGSSFINEKVQNKQAFKFPYIGSITYSSLTEILVVSFLLVPGFKLKTSLIMPSRIMESVLVNLASLKSLKAFNMMCSSII